MSAERNEAARVDAGTIERHGEEISGRWTDVDRRARLFDRAVELRRRDRTLPDFEAVADGRGDQVLVASGELLVKAEQLRDRESALAPGTKVVPVEELGGRVVRLILPPERQGLGADRDGLRRTGVPAAFNYVTAMAVVIKSQGGATPAARSWPPPEVTPAGGSRVRVAVLDTGVTGQTRTDGWLAGIARPAGTLDPADPGNVDPLDVSPHNTLLDAAGGHGTAVSGIVQHEAPGVTLAAYNPIPSDGGASETDIGIWMVRAVQEAFAAGQSVVLNLSLGTTTVDDEPPLALQAAVDTIEALSAASEYDALIVAAAGNYGDDRLVWPAACRGVVAVGGLTQQLTGTSWSSRGPWVDCSVIGDGVLSTYVQGQEDPDFGEPADTFGPDPFALLWGTSFAAPQVAGRVARIAEDEKVSLRDALGRLLTGTSRLPGFGRVLAVQPPVV